MPLSFVRQGNPRVYIPGYKSGISSGAFNQIVSNVTKNNFGANFDEGQLASLNQGRADLNAQALVSMGIKAPAYAFEAPLRPLDAATGGFLSGATNAVAGAIGHIPVLNTIVGGIGDFFTAADRAGAGWVNYLGADALRQSIGKPDDFKLGLFGTGQTAGEARANALKRWGTDLDGNKYTLAQLEERAQNNPWDFGQFATSEDGLTDMFVRGAVNPFNLLLIPGAATLPFRAAGVGAKYLSGWSKASQWAKPIQTVRIPGMPAMARGYGYMADMGRGIAKPVGEFLDEAHNPTLRSEFLDLGNASRDVMEGNLARSGYVRSLLQSASWMGRGARAVQKVYFPGINTELSGARLAGSAARAWMRGGIQQEAIGLGSEALFGGIDNYLQENDMNGNFVGGTVSWLHDTLSKVNNQHPLSDHDQFVMMAMFLPSFGIAREGLGAPGRALRRATSDIYVNRTAAQLLEKSQKQFGTSFKTVDEMLTYLGDGDKARGIKTWEWYTEFADVSKAENQLAHLTHATADAEIDGMAQRSIYMDRTITEDIIRRRRSGALQPNSTADYMIDMHRNPGLTPKGGVEASSQFTPTATSHFDEIKNLYHAHETLTPQLRELGLRIVKGGILDRETLDAIIEHVKRSDTFDQTLARQVLDMGPGLIYGENAQFWREFSVTLGRKERETIPGRLVADIETISKDDLLAALEDAKNYVPSNQELFHETIRAAKSVGTVRKGLLTVKEPPYPMGAKLKANRLKTAGRVKTYAYNNQTMTRMREREFFKNGKAKFGTAEEVTSQDGLRYHRRDDGFYARSDGVAVGIEDGAIRLEVPPTREADLLAQLDKTLFRSGPRKGQIRPGMEAESQRLNLAIEDARMGMDRDALITAVQHGGRVIVASPMAGPWLARHGFLESARIEHRYPHWIDPGDKPEPDYKTLEGMGLKEPMLGQEVEYNAPSLTDATVGKGKVADFVDDVSGTAVVIEDSVSGNLVQVPISDVTWAGKNKLGLEPAEAEAIWAEYDAGFHKWRSEMTRGVVRGDISIEAAKARGWVPTWDYRPLPKTLYHATTHAKAVRKTGLKTTGELGGASRTGLGGAPSSVSSFTSDPAVANRIKDVLVESGKFLRGEMTIKDLATTAKKLGFLDEFIASVGRPLYDRVRKDKWLKKTEVPAGFDFFGGITTWKEVLEPMTEDEILSTRSFIYDKFLKEQDWKMGGKSGHIEYLDPVLVADDLANPLEVIKSRRDIMPGDATVVRAHPVSDKALGVHDMGEPYLREWKIMPETVSIEGVSDQAAYSFRGGDPMAIVENSAAGAFRDYRPTRRFERTEAAAVGVARGDARRNSLLHPTDWSVGPSPTPETSMFPEERLRTLQENIRSTRNAYKNELKAVSELDEFAQSLFPFDKKIKDMGLQDWADPLTRPEWEKVKTFFETAEKDFPNLSFTREPGMIVDPAESRLMTYQTSLNRYERLFMDYGPLAPIQRFYDALLAPKAQRWLGKQMQDEVHNLLTVAGWTPGATRQYMAALRKEVLDSRDVVGLGKLIGSHKYSSVQALPEEKLRALARDIAPAETASVIDRYGTFQHMFTQAGNRLLRTTTKKARSGAALSPMEEAADKAFRVWQYAPGFRSVSGAMQRFTKYTYPLIRFRADPLFVMMNYTEPYVYNILNNGWRGIELAKGRTPATSRRNLELASKGNIPPGGLYDTEVATDLLLADPGFYTLPSNIRPNLEAEFHLKTAKTAEQVFRAMGPEHPIAKIMRERFGDNVKDWAEEFNKTLATLAKYGPEHLTRKAFKESLEQELGFSHAELKQLTPVAEALTEKYRGIAHDLADLYVGRMNRSNLERMANNFFIAWPVSYMVKVTGWAYKILFEKLGPVQGNVGAYLWDNYRKQYEHMMENDNDFANWTEENPDFLFAVEMLMPITPISIGVSLNKTTRYAGNWLTQQALSDPSAAPFGDYTPASIPEMLSGSLRFGPWRTARLASNTLKGFGVPGFYTEPSSNRAPPLTP